MYKQNVITKTDLKVNNSYEGETIEQKMNRILSNKEPISDGAPLIYQDRKEGVNPDYDIRTDRFDVAVEAMDKVAKSHKARREERQKLADLKKTAETMKDAGGEPIQGTGNEL